MRSWIASLLDLIFPSRCHHCETSLKDGRSLCDDCFRSLSRVESPYCLKCGEPFDGKFSENPICPNCHGRTFSFTYAKAALSNDTETRKLVLDFKYGRQRYLAKELARLCAEVIQQDDRFNTLPDPALIPVPLHWRRKLKRGFNQAELLAEQITKLTDIPTENLLKRTRYTTTQTRLNRKQRMKNLRNAFALRTPAEQIRSAILIDDVFTTGSTADACAALIQKECPNIENIVVVTVLRG